MATQLSSEPSMRSNECVLPEKEHNLPVPTQKKKKRTFFHKEWNPVFPLQRHVNANKLRFISSILFLSPLIQSLGQ